MLLHGPPYGYGDRTARGERVGSRAALARIRELEPALAVFGHIHEARGGWQVGPTQLANAAFVDGSYQPNGEPPMVFDLRVCRQPERA